MGKRPTRRGHGGESLVYPLWTPNTDQRGWRVAREISFAQGEAKCVSGEWDRVRDDYGNLSGYSMRVSVKTDQDLPGGATSTSITVREVLMSAGVFGKSRTMGMTEEQRITRRDGRKFLPPEDAIERATAKVRQWPIPASRIDDGSSKPVYGDRATRIYPRA